jgi:tetratricopeptide (TPR) repeat protein
MTRTRAALLLAVITLLAYLPVLQNGFVNYDDPDYVTENPVVQNGLTFAGIRWAFTGWHASNWHPLTWLSHMADCGLFRLNPAGHHFVNVLFHSANTALVFLLIARLTQKIWPSVLVALLFAWHPLHVESVAWVAERKDVLSTFFALLALLSYAKLGETAADQKARSGRCFGLCLLFFALSLLAKPMFVTLPFIFLLLDFWPLNRFPLSAFRLPLFGRLLLEKIPFFGLAAVSCAVTFFAQRQEAVATLQKVPLDLRLENVVVSYADYLAGTFCPLNLAVFYPLPKHIPLTVLILSAAILIAISVLAVRGIRSRPYILMGWLWFLGTLVPVIGLVQVGDQALADRYTYFPLIGIFLILALAACEFASRLPGAQKPLLVIAGVVCAACLLLTEKQISYWRDSETLFRHALAVTDDNALAHLNLGVALQDANRPQDALVQYKETLRLDPARREADNNIARILNDAGQPAEALGYARAALRLDAKSASAHVTLGMILAELKNYDEATGEFLKAMQLDKNYAPAPFQIARTLLLQGRDAQAQPYFQSALELDPQNLSMLIYTARVLATDENPEGRNDTYALVLTGQIVQVAGGASPVVLDTLAAVCAENGRFDEAVKFEQQALTLVQNTGQKDDAAEIQQHLDLYRQHQPWRKSFRAP